MRGWKGPKEARDVIRTARDAYLKKHPAEPKAESAG
jgi:hypothetical protein